MIRQVVSGCIVLVAISPIGGQPPLRGKELARSYETKAAELTDPKEATAEWGKALKEWTVVFQRAKAELDNLPADATPAMVKATKSNFYDAYFEIQRVVATANTQLIKDPTRQATCAETGAKKLLDLENLHKFNDTKAGPAGPDGKPTQIKLGTELINNEVWSKYCDFLDKFPAIQAEYKKQGGKFFLERPKTE